MTTPTLEEQITLLDTALQDAEKQATAIVGRMRKLRQKAALGDIASIASDFEPLPGQLDQVTAALQRARETVTYDPAAALADGSYVQELKAHARSESVVINDVEGRLTAFPLLLKIEPRAPGFRVGRKVYKTLRPSVIVKLLRKAQSASRFDAGRFLGSLFKGYERVAPLLQPGWTTKTPGPGPVVPLNDIYEILTLHPAAAADYAREEFATDLLRLESHPDATGPGGRRFTLPASTASKGRNRLTIYDETGAERVFATIGFSAPPPGADHGG